MAPLDDIVRRIGRRLHRRPASGGGRADAHGSSTSDSSLVAALAELTATRRHAEAVSLVEEHLASHRDDLAFLKQARTSTSAAGAISWQREALEAQLALGGGPSVEAAARQLEGRWRETSPDWAPTIDPDTLAGLERREPLRGHVLHVLKISMPYRQSGYSMRSMYTLTGQRRSGLHPVAVTALDFPPAEEGLEVPPSEEVQGVLHHRLRRDAVPPKQPWDAYLDDWATALAPVVAQERPEVIHVHSGNRGYESALVALSVGRALGIPVVYEVRGFFESLWTSNTAWSEHSEVYRRRYDTEARCMREAAAVVTLSDSMREDIMARGVPGEQVHVVPNGVDNSVFAPRDRSPELMRQWGLEGSFVFGYVSNLDHYREGQELLIRAAVELRRRGVHATALIVGDGRRRQVLQELAAEVAAGDAVVFTGKVPHEAVLDYYALYDVFVVPRVDERAARLVTPLKPFEAMAMGVPVVVSDLPALREITGDGARGVSFRTGDVESLVEVLAELSADPDRRQRVAQAARTWVVEERDWSRNGERYRAIYEAVLDRQM